MPPNLLRNIPSVSELLENPQLKSLVDRVSRNVVVNKARSLIDDLRSEVRSAASEIALPSVAELAEKLAQRILQGEEPKLRAIVNATGRLLPSALGRAPLAAEAVEEIAAIARDYASVELDLSSGQRRQRHAAVEGMICDLTGAEAALAVNNHAAATVLALAALASGREAVVSRGCLTERDDGYRLADAIAASGADLREAGTINCTRIEDYRDAIGDRSAALLAVDSDIAMQGRVESPSLDDLIRLGRERRLPIIHDAGNAALVDFNEYGCKGVGLLQARADVLLFSGDALLGGPPCGIIAGRGDLIAKISQHPLSRAVQIEKLSLAALVATLRLYRNPASARREIPLLQLLGTPEENLKNRAERLAPLLAACPAAAKAEIEAGQASLGESALPSERIPSWTVAVTPAPSWSAERLVAALRSGHPAVLVRQEAGRAVFDLRTVFPRQDQTLVAALEAVQPPKSS